MYILQNLDSVKDLKDDWSTDIKSMVRLSPLYPHTIPSCTFGMWQEFSDLDSASETFQIQLIAQSLPSKQNKLTRGILLTR